VKTLSADVASLEEAKDHAFTPPPKAWIESRVAALTDLRDQRTERSALDSAGRSNLPHLRCDLDDPETVRLANAFGAPVTYHAKTHRGSLRGAAVAAGVQCLLYEGGEAHRFDVDAVATALRGAERVLAAAGMLPDSPSQPSPTVEVRQSRWMRASRSGFARVTVALGARVREGDLVATVAHAFGSEEVAPRSRLTGIVIGVLREPQVHGGDALVHVAKA